LYIYAHNGKGKTVGDIEIDSGENGYRVNFRPEFVKEIEGRLGLRFTESPKGDMKETVGAEDVFAYIYAVLNCPGYQQAYEEYLRLEFPRVPVTSDRRLFERLCGLGDELVAAHLIERLPESKVRFPVEGSNEVETSRVVAPEAKKGRETGRVYINRTQFFEGISTEVWNFNIGGYQVPRKWLLERKGCTLSFEDIEHYRSVITAIGETIRVMAEIDAAVPNWPIP